MSSLRLFVLLIQMSACAALFAGGQTLTPLDERVQAPDLSLPGIDGKSISLSDFQGEVVVPDADVVAVTAVEPAALAASLRTGVTERVSC